MREQDDLQRRGIGMTSQRTRERLIQRLSEEGVSNPKVLDAIRRTPRHLFVDEALAHRAYEDTALPIGHNQTISQPFMVAHMSELLLEAGPLDKVLEIGTGSGYQTAILAQLVERVFSVERIKSSGPGQGASARAELAQRGVSLGRWLRRLAGAGALQWHHRHCGGCASATGVARPAGPRRSHGNSGGPGWRGATTDADRA